MNDPLRESLFSSSDEEYEYVRSFLLLRILLGSELLHKMSLFLEALFCGGAEDSSGDCDDLMF